MDQKAILDHQFLIAAYIVTWVVQLGYVTSLVLRWRAARRSQTRSRDTLR